MKVTGLPGQENSVGAISALADSQADEAVFLENMIVKLMGPRVKEWCNHCLPLFVSQGSKDSVPADLSEGVEY